MVHEAGARGLDRFLICEFETRHSSDQDDPLTARERGVLRRRRRADHGTDLLLRISPLASLLKLPQLAVFLPHGFLSLCEQVLQLAHFIGQLSELSFQCSAFPPALGRRCQPPLQRIALLKRLAQLLDLLGQGLLPCFTTSGFSRRCFPFPHGMVDHSLASPHEQLLDHLIFHRLQLLPRIGEEGLQAPGQRQHRGDCLGRAETPGLFDGPTRQ